MHYILSLQSGNYIIFEQNDYFTLNICIIPLAIPIENIVWSIRSTATEYTGD